MTPYSPYMPFTPVTPVTGGGSVDGMLLYVYGNVTAVGSETNGDTVNGTCTRSGCVPAFLWAAGVSCLVIILLVG